MASEARALLTCEHLACGYDEQPVLEDIALHVSPRRIVAILGGSGSGKSTLLKTVGGLLRPLNGTVTLFDQNLYEVDEAKRRALLARTGTVFQHDALFGSMSILENLLLPIRELTQLRGEAAVELARAKLALVDLLGLERRNPFEISGGQRKRVALARATMLDPQLLFCDEPTSGLDPLMAASIDHTLRQFADVLGVGIIIITHDVDSVRAIADRAALLKDARIHAAGSVSDLMSSDDVFVRKFFHRSRPESEAG